MAETGIPVLAPTLTTAGTAATTIIGAAALPGALTGASLAVPVIGVAIAGISLAIGLWMNRKGPQQKVATTKIVDEAESFLQQYKAAWDASPTKNQAEKELYLSDFYKIWSQVVEACSNDAYGNPGHSCIEDRMPSGMSINANGKSYTGNGKWNWWVYYYDPVANYQPTSSGDFATDLFNGGIGNFTSGPLGILAVIGLGLAGLALVFNGKE